jgi:hypothetical protein
MPDPAASATRDFWQSSGYRLLAPDGAGRLPVSDDLLRAYLLRPELAPIEESCAAERDLHARLMAAPREPVDAPALERLADADASENYGRFLAFRGRLLAASSLEAAYLDLVERGLEGIPPLFLDQLAHLILRHVLAGTGDPIRLRAAEMLFREQKVTIQDGRVMLADEETVEMHASGQGFGSLGRLLVEAETPLRSVELDVLDEDNAALYWARSDRFDMVLDLAFTRPGLDALCRVLEAWVGHFLAVEVQIQPVQQISDERWVWHVGLDSEASALLNDLYGSESVDEARLARLLALFRLEFKDPKAMAERIRGRPVYLGLMMTAAGRLKLKPQNLLLNLPLAERS